MVRMIACLCIVFCAGCSNEHNIENDVESQTDTATSSMQPIDTKQPHTNLTGCYMRVLQRDTLAASLVQEGKTVTGKLTFDNYQKDGSSGTVTGIVEDNILKLVYRFHSEGMNSISEVYFKVTGDGLVRGLGEVQVKGDSAYFPDPANITYNEKEKLLKLPCSDLPGKYR